MNKLLARNVPLTLAGRQYTCDILLGMYVSTLRPSILLADSRPESLAGDIAWLGEPIAIASSNAPVEYLQHLPQTCFAAKTWTENEGLWEQLLELADEHATLPLFIKTKWAVTLGFAKAPIIQLGHHAEELFHELRNEAMVSSLSNRKTLFQD
jgi:hypothetical protein